MAYTVKQVARMSKVSVRTLHFYDEVGLLKPARVGSNGYRYYEEEQLLRLQQVLFYRELGMGLKQIGEVLGKKNFKVAGALKGHRKVLAEKMERMGKLIATIDKTIGHLKGKKKMKGDELFAGFSVAAGEDRFGNHNVLGGPGGEPMDCKVSGEDTNGAMCVFEFECLAGGPKHLHQNQDEWIYVVEGEFDFLIGKKELRLKAGESVFIPRQVGHVWRSAGGQRGKIINVYQPARKIEEFWKEVGRYDGKPAIHEALGVKGLHELFEKYEMDLMGPPMGWDDNKLTAQHD